MNPAAFCEGCGLYQLWLTASAMMFGAVIRHPSAIVMSFEIISLAITIAAISSKTIAAIVILPIIPAVTSCVLTVLERIFAIASIILTVFEIIPSVSHRVPFVTHGISAIIIIIGISILFMARIPRVFS